MDNWLSRGYFYRLFIKNKTLRTHKNIAIAGESVFKPSLLSSRIGANLDELTAGKIENNSRIISGSVLFGHDAKDAMSYLGYYDNQVSVISNMPNDIFMNWLMPGKTLHSKLNVFISSFIKPKKFTFNTSINGGNRAIVPVGSYEEIIPRYISYSAFKGTSSVDIEVAADLECLS